MGRFKHWILNTLCKKELLEIHNHYSNQVKRIQFDANKQNQDIEIVHSILSEKNSVLVGEADNKSGEHVFVVQQVYGRSIDFLLYSNKYKAICNHPRIMGTYNSFYGNEVYVKIEDILVEDNNAGNGSILMPYFIEYCKNHTDAKKITGWLSSVDSGHFDRSVHFYKKHGFDVVLSDDGSSGSIELQLREASV